LLRHGAFLQQVVDCTHARLLHGERLLGLGGREAQLDQVLYVLQVARTI
jgi:hypothetical protein